MNGYRHYSGVIMDMYYDHFMANLWSKYSNEKLEDFAICIYDTIEASWDHIPEQARFMFPYMKSGNWLVRYATTEGIGRSLTGMSKRLNNSSNLEYAVEQLKEHYQDLKLEFKEFIQEAYTHFHDY